MFPHLLPLGDCRRHGGEAYCAAAVSVPRPGAALRACYPERLELTGMLPQAGRTNLGAAVRSLDMNDRGGLGAVELDRCTV